MTEITLIAQPLTKEAFAPYGDVIEVKDASHFSINEGTIERFHDLAKIDIGDDPQAKVIYSIASSNHATKLPCKVKLVERHPLGTQIFYPLFNDPMIVVVTEKADIPDPAGFKAFVSNGKQGINYHRNVWHLPLISLKAEEKFIIVDRDGPGNNCDVYHFDESDQITLQPIS